MKLKHSEVISLVVVILVLFLGIKIYTEYENDYKEKRMNSIESQISFYYKSCYNEQKCSNESSVEELYNLGYITNEYINPYTGETINKNATLKYDNETITIEGLND